MSIFSDYAVGALSDEEFDAECIHMNNRDRIEQQEIDEQLYHDDLDDESGLLEEDE